MIRIKIAPKKIEEAAYKGNVGIMELMTFFNKSTPQQQQQFDHFIDSGNQDEAWDLVKSVTGVDLVGLGSSPSRKKQPAR